MIIWGTKKVRRTLGYVAENCPRCQIIRCVKVARLGMASHVYFIAVDDGRLLANIGVCCQCEGEFVVEPTDYPDLAKGKSTNLTDLALQTNPMLGATPEMRKEHERLAAVREPFLRYNLSLEDRYVKGSHIDWRAALAFLGTILAGVAVCVAAVSAEDQHKQWLATSLTYFAVAVFVAGLVWSVLLQKQEPKRFFRKRILPEIRQALQPLQVSRAELSECLRRLAKYRFRIARLVQEPDLS